MRLVQRHGRVDRIGSPHRHIQLRCFFPDEDLEDLLNLEDRLQRKLKQASAAFGGDQVLPGVRSTAVGPVDRVLSETRHQIMQLKAGDAALLSATNSVGASSEEYQRRLVNAISSASIKKAMLDLPWGAGTGFIRAGTEPGIVFCVRIADREQPEFRYVPLQASPDAGHTRLVPTFADGTLEIDDSTLQSLITADPRDHNTPADLPQELHDAVLDVWPQVQQSVFDDWSVYTDPANTQPDVPKVMRDAATLVRRAGGFLGDQQDKLVDRLGQDIDVPRQRLIRQAMRDNEGDTEAAIKALRKVADDLHLSVPEVMPLRPEIELEDVRLVVWAAVHPG